CCVWCFTLPPPGMGGANEHRTAQCFLERDFSEALRGFPARMVWRAVLPTRGVGEQAALVLEMPHQRRPVGFLGRRIGFGDEAGATEIDGRLPGMSGVGPGFAVDSAVIIEQPQL